MYYQKVAASRSDEGSMAVVRERNNEGGIAFWGKDRDGVVLTLV